MLGRLTFVTTYDRRRLLEGAFRVGAAFSDWRGAYMGCEAVYVSMVELSEISIGETYEFTIEQRGEEYTAVVEMDTIMGSTTETAVGVVQESTYPTGGWEGEQFRIHEDGTVDQFGNVFGPIGEVRDVREMG